MILCNSPYLGERAPLTSSGLLRVTSLTLPGNLGNPACSHCRQCRNGAPLSDVNRRKRGFGVFRFNGKSLPVAQYFMIMNDTNCSDSVA